MKTLKTRIGETILNKYRKKNKRPIQGMLFMILTVILIISAFFALCFIAGGCAPKEEVSLYFAKYEDNLTYLAPETRDVFRDEFFFKTIIEELVKGPENEQLYPTLPSSVKINSVTINGSLAIVDFSKEIITDNSSIPHSSTTEILAIFSIVDTLTEFDEILKVRITIEGKRDGQIDGMYIQDFWGHVGIYEDFSRNEEILTKSSGS